MRVRLTPLTSGADGTREFDVIGVESLNTTTGELTLTCRDGRVCVGLVGSWDIGIRASFRPAMSCDDVVRIHDGNALVFTVN